MGKITGKLWENLELVAVIWRIIIIRCFYKQFERKHFLRILNKLIIMVKLSFNFNFKLVESWDKHYFCLILYPPTQVLKSIYNVKFNYSYKSHKNYHLYEHLDERLDDIDKYYYEYSFECNKFLWTFMQTFTSYEYSYEYSYEDR